VAILHGEGQTRETKNRFKKKRPQTRAFPRGGDHKARYAGREGWAEERNTRGE